MTIKKFIYYKKFMIIKNCQLKFMIYKIDFNN